jgi:protein TonB
MIFPAILAVGIHGLLFGMEINWLGGEPSAKPKSPAMTMTLTYLQPPKQQLKPVPQKPTPVTKKVIKKVKKTNLKPKPLPKPKSDFIPLSRLKPEVQPQIPVKKIKPIPVNTHLETISDTVPVVFSNKSAKTLTATPAPVIRKAIPLYRVNPPPKYPRAARKKKYQGVVLLEVLVNQAGRVHDLKVLQSSGHVILDKAARVSVKKWEFEPGRHGNDKVDMWVRVPIRFQLK